MKQRQIIAWAANELEQAEVLEPLNDAVLLWLYCTDMDKKEYLMNQEKEYPYGIPENYRTCISRRCSREPLQYIVGFQNFMGYDFITEKNVLIPRFDTEILVEQMIDFIRKRYQKENVRILDMCCGTGCIGLSLKLFCGDSAEVLLCDISEDAVRITKKNAEKLNAHCRVIKSNLFESIEGRFDVIVSNPPYIKSSEIQALMPEVRDFEPILALDGRSDGLYFYRKITKEAELYFDEQGYLFFEIGYDQAYDVQQLLVDRGYTDVQIVKDLAGKNRVVYGTYTR